MFEQANSQNGSNVIPPSPPNAADAGPSRFRRSRRGLVLESNAGVLTQEGENGTAPASTAAGAAAGAGAGAAGAAVSVPTTMLPDPKNVSTWLGEDEILQIRIAQSDLYSTDDVDEERRSWWSQAGESSSSSSSSSNGTDVVFNPDYIFTSNAPLLYLDSDFLARHEVKRINVTLDEMCVTKGPGLGFVLAAVVGDLDTIIINQLMNTFRNDGVVRSMRTNETWSWRGESLPPVGGYSIFSLDGWVFRIFALLRSLSAFFFLSGTTAIVVRMLMTSGVALMYPVFFCLRRMGVTGLSFRVLTRSYAWLGVPLERLRARGKPLAPFLLAHLSKVLVVYVMYEACQVFFLETLYSKSGTSGVAFAVFGLIMLLEYVSMLYVRSGE